MAGVADAAFRGICREAGAALTTSEMVSAKALCYNKHDNKTRSLMTPFETEGPYAIQLFGSEPDILAEGAKIACEYANPDMIDLNMGCPVPKVAQNGEGSALMKNPALIGQIVGAVKGAIDRPLTVKMRLGWDDDSINAVECAKICEANGADAVTVHGRTRAMFYSGQARMEEIARVVAAVNIPVIANGDIFTGADALRLYRETGAPMVAVGRGALGNPWIFSEINALLENKEFTHPSIRDKMNTLKRQIQGAAARKGEYTAVREARAQTMYYVKGLHGASRLKDEASKLSTMEEVAAFCNRVAEQYS
ncbi:MAG: tRNA dihydrouridine synthase DusB [Clostridia bacterium]|nr:tRNA dihydrouridine synthase DusB [Clostridia bacterium]